MTSNLVDGCAIERSAFEVAIDGAMGYAERSRSCPPVHKIYCTVGDARLTILEVPLRARRGLFRRAGSDFEATVQIFNAAPGETADVQPKLVSLGIKVRGVAGPKLLPGEEDGDVCDFLLHASPGSIMRQVEDLPVVLEQRIKGKPFAEFRRRFSVANFLVLKAMLRLVKNPLTCNYYSTTPYCLGDRVVKYVLVPNQRSNFLALPNFFDRDFLRHAAEKSLRSSGASFTLCVQFHQELEPIEDASVAWTGELIPVALLELPQLVESAELVQGNRLYFHPWRTLEEHTPVGWVNQMFRSIWVSHLRRQSAA